MKYQQVHQLLIQLQRELRIVNLWQQDAPSAQALSSVEPFAVDTLEFHQWLQFIMLPRMQAIVAQQLPLPENMAVSPMAEHVYRGQLQKYRSLIACLRELDVLVTGQDPMAQT